MSIEDRRIFNMLMLVPRSPDDLHVRRSSRALELNPERAPDDERLPPLSHFQAIARPPIDPVTERSLIAGSWLEGRVEKILKYEHEADWEREEKVQIFSFRDTWAIGGPLAGIQIYEISQLMFGKYVEPMWYLDSQHCYWYEREQ
ncbi:hypothetical protein HGRIS_009226 [Hohenbuehelia grisea]|uniref:Uncharacterized protein n=1 Tax=Hohenbuehelia grisea TaxID=104357 RepID=A0ABR3J0H7_9AGAR